ncbi:MAG: LemA family protein [Alphaproteobacteria bacterium]|nr:LemA family protein [Alphaproteobacteria bacterium]
MFTLVLVLVFVAVLGYFGLYTYNKLASASQYIQTAWGELDVLLSQRYQILADLIRKIANFTNREQSLVQKLVDLRYAALLLQKKGADRSFQENMITAAVPDVCALLKKYPELKEDKPFMDSLKDFVSISNQILASIRLYNKTAKLINDLVQTFPTSLVADMWHITSQDLIAIQDVVLPDVDHLGEQPQAENTEKKE